MDCNNGKYGKTGKVIDEITKYVIVDELYVTSPCYIKATETEVRINSNSEIYIHPQIVPPGIVYACADPEFVGVMPVRQDIEVLPADEPKQ